MKLCGPLKFTEVRNISELDSSDSGSVQIRTLVNVAMMFKFSPLQDLEALRVVRG
jgi:hypothetical protein